MGIVKEYNRPVADAGRLQNVQLAATTGVAMVNYGLTVVSATGVFDLGAPVAGLGKTVVSSGVTISVDGAGATINGSTAQALEDLDALELVGISTGAWAIVSLTTA